MAARNVQLTKAIVANWKNRIGSRPVLVSEDLQRALLAACVMDSLIRTATYDPNRPIENYANLYFEAKAALMLNNGSIETERLVAGKFGI